MQAPPFPENEIKRLQALREQELLDTAPEERFDRITRLAKHLFGVETALVSLIDADRQWFKSKQGLEACETGRDISFCGHAILGTDTFEVNDARLDYRFADNPLVTGAPYIRFYAGAPLSTPDGYTIGTLCIIDSRPRTLNQEEKQSLRDLADCVEAQLNLHLTIDAQLQLARLSRVASQTTNGVIITDTEGKIDWINEGFTRITGYSLNEVIHRKPGDLLQGMQSDPETIQYIRQQLSRKESFSAELINYRKDGQPYWVQISCDPLRDASGKLQGYMAIETDISARKQAEEKLRETTQFLDSILENVPNMIFLKRADNLRFEFFNRAGEVLLGLDRDQLIGHNDYDFFPPEQADFFTANDRRVLTQAGIVDIAEEPIETPHGTRFLHTRKLPLRDRKGRPQYLLGISEDITERKEAERMKNQFVSIVSHELRTPITAISGALGLLHGSALGVLPQPVTELISLAYNNSQRLAFLINDLLDMEKLSAGKMHFDFQLYPLHELVEQAIASNRAYGSNRNVQLHCEPCPTDLLVRVDKQRFLQVMSNLLSNAIKYSPDNGLVTIGFNQQGDRVTTSVIDHGPGIPAEFYSRMFEKFSQADSSNTRKIGGTGLGLAITKELLARMDGHIEFESTPHVATRFYFDLPAWHSEASKQ